MIQFHYQTDFKLSSEEEYTTWVLRVLETYGKSPGDLNYIFCTDEHLLGINQEYLKHDYYTDIITFPYNEGDTIQGDIFISIERVADNALEYEVSFETELKRVMIHGVLHLLGYGDKDEREALEMRRREDGAIEMFHVKH